jgi:hypothetical protein
LETKHRPDALLDGSMILFDTIVQVGTLLDPDRLQLGSRTVRQLALDTTRQDGFLNGLAAVDHNSLRSAVLIERLAQRVLGSS